MDSGFPGEEPTASTPQNTALWGPSSVWRLRKPNPAALEGPGLTFDEQALPLRPL